MEYPVGCILVSFSKKWILRKYIFHKQKWNYQELTMMFQKLGGLKLQSNLESGQLNFFSKKKKKTTDICMCFKYMFSFSEICNIYVELEIEIPQTLFGFPTRCWQEDKKIFYHLSRYISKSTLPGWLGAERAVRFGIMVELNTPMLSYSRRVF